MTWQSIETAPKDGTLIIGWDARQLRGKGLPRFCIWAKNLNTNQMCWMGIELAVEIELTHWMPAPEEPWQWWHDRED